MHRHAHTFPSLSPPALPCSRHVPRTRKGARKAHPHGNTTLPTPHVVIQLPQPQGRRRRQSRRTVTRHKESIAENYCCFSTENYMFFV